MMEDPVTTPNGQSYERAALEVWIDAEGTDPQTRQPLTKADLRPNIALRDAIQEWKIIDKEWQQRVQQLKDELRSSESAAPAAAASSSSSATERQLRQVISYMQSRPLYAANKARVGVSAALDVPPLLRNALALHKTSKMLTENGEQIVKGMIAGMHDNGDEMYRIFEPLVHMAGTAATNRERSWLHTQLGTAFHKKGKTATDAGRQKALYVLAIEQFQTAAALDPDNAEAKRHWAWEIDRLALHETDVAKKAKMHDDSLDLFEAALKINPFDAEVWDNKGRALRAVKQADEALKAFERCTELCPDHIQAWCAQGEIHGEKSRWPEAERCFHQAIGINPKDAISNWKLGKLFQRHAATDKTIARQQQHALFRDAAKYHKTAIQLDPHNASFYADGGYCLSRIGKFDEARKLLESGMKLNPHHKECKKNLDFLNNRKK